MIFDIKLFIFFYIGVDYTMTVDVSFNVICGKQIFSWLSLAIARQTDVHVFLS
jgi:hypothetical protein